MKIYFLKKSLIVALALIAAFSLISGYLLYVNFQTPSTDLENVILAVPPLEQNALLYIAYDQGIFVNNGLNITIRNYDTGVSSISSMLNGEADIAEAAELPFINAVFQNKQVTLIASNDQFDNNYIVALKDHGIENISDLKGKTIAVARGTIAEFCLSRFLELNRISLQDVSIMGIKPGEFVSVLANETADAAVVWQPYFDQVQHQVNRTVAWSAQSGQAVYGVLVCNSEWVNQHENTIERFLKSLADAEEFLINKPAEAKVIVRDQLHYSDSYITSIWSKHAFSLSLRRPLIVAMNDEAQWSIDNNLVEGTNQIPNFADYIYLDGLAKIKPESVDIIR
jgi:NitT/TauT family transport system substrate-binding protein